MGVNAGEVERCVNTKQVTDILCGVSVPTARPSTSSKQNIPKEF